MRLVPASTPTTTFPGGSSLLGKKVEIQRQGKVLRVGYVESATPSGEVVWLEASGIEQRAMYGPAFGHRVIPLSD
ncbi:hypothetical protein [Pseudarthrobacter sp. NamE5]|uniref:hypothetical protein n=1 Tax=Pseudarthrobacter sp. NamE5 TaxID=2576839 RepID=UPI00110C1A7A|nr:hypothetical protein [Pseudarthrobacter sp. NamE5]TLM87080.1 hypothetical protein FDW84_04520 [Pseudarthrobacter sp. NamE5]